MDGSAAEGGLGATFFRLRDQIATAARMARTTMIRAIRRYPSTGGRPSTEAEDVLLFFPVGGAPPVEVNWTVSDTEWPATVIVPEACPIVYPETAPTV